MKQYLRSCQLIVATASGDGLDLSRLTIRFKVKKTDTQTPNAAEIRVYNLSADTISQIRREFTQITLQAGYEGNTGVIFAGTIKQVRTGREAGTDVYIDIDAGDGDIDYNNAIVNTTLSAGARQIDQVNAASRAMTNTSQGYIPDLGSNSLPRGKVLYGMARDYLRQSAESSGTSWSIQDGKLQMVGLNTTLPTQAVILNSKTGLIGQAEQTNDGIKARCLLNPMLKIGGRVQINEADILSAKIDNTDKSSPVNSAPSVTADGFYRVLMVEYSGDTRGNDWYADVVCQSIDATQPPRGTVNG